jgi:hypothetical protein
MPRNCLNTVYLITHNKKLIFFYLFFEFQEFFKVEPCPQVSVFFFCCMVNYALPLRGGGYIRLLSRGRKRKRDI